ncbi:TPA: EamA family transporter, partial [Pseudomonas aeruginosa]|nr:EamA family transporter [Pseudomonas aeruginosa]
MADPPRPVERAMRSQALRADVLMLITAMIWGVSFVAQRL